MNKTCFITGGAGFIGSNYILHWLAREAGTVINIDKMTYAGSPLFLEEMQSQSRHIHEAADISDAEQVRRLFRTYRPHSIVHFAGESHIDRSIADPTPFLQTNVIGTFVLLETVREYLSTLSEQEQKEFRFVHISTDEVFGSLDFQSEKRFSESSCYAPGTPYAASKAAGDHFIRAWCKTYCIPTILVNCSNNYGPRQSPEKLVPKTIMQLLSSRAVPVYGDGLHIRDWLYVEDCCEAVYRVWKYGRVGERYNIGGNAEHNVLEVIQRIGTLFGHKNSEPFIVFQADRPANDRRYALNTSKIKRELGWQPQVRFEEGMERTVRWYLEHQHWLCEAENRITFI